MRTTKTDVLIIGAGPTGLMMANLLARYGVVFRIVDKKAGPTEESRALVVHAKTLELLERLGLAQQAVAEGRTMDAIDLYREGKYTGVISFLDKSGDDRTPYPLVLIYEQSRIERLLLQGLVQAGQQVEWRTEMVSLEQEAGDVCIQVKRPDGQEEMIEAKWVVSADGAHSPIRHALAMEFTGGTYEQTLYLADVDLEGELSTQRVSIDLTSTGFNGYFPMPGGEKRFRLLGALPPEFSGRDTLTFDDLRQLLKRTSNMKMSLLDARWLSIYRIHHRMSKHFRFNRVFLVGDAAHIHSPAGGQGMNTGIGDAYNLAWKLALVVKGQAHEPLLDSYEAERMPFARAILNGSDKGFALQVNKSFLAHQVKLHIIPLLFRLLSTLPPLSRWVFWYLSQLWTTYGSNPALVTADRTRKGVKAGARAPYGFFEEGSDSGQSIFSKITGLDYHLLLFAGRHPNSDASVMRNQVQTLPGAYPLPIHLHVVSQGNRQLHTRYGVDEPTVFLIRPDGHIAYRGSAHDPELLRSYLDTLLVRHP